jgi:NTE family protein
LVGTSVGAINAAFWAFDPEPWMGERLLRFWLQANNALFFPNGPVPMVGRLVQGKDHLSTQSALAALLHTALPHDATIEEAAIPVSFTATDVRHGEKVVLRSGPVLPAVLASAAIPALFPPIEVGGRLLADGGMTANCDIETAVEAGMTDVLVVDVMGDGVGTPPRGVWATAEDALGVAVRRQTQLTIRLFEHRARIAVVRPLLTARPRLFDFSRTADLYRHGRSAGERFLSEVLSGKRVVPGVHEYAPEDEAAPAPARRALDAAATSA